GIDGSEAAWSLASVIVEHLARIWHQPDEGIWEVRGSARHFVHSKLMAWVAFDRMIASASIYGLSGPLERWRRIRDEIHADICRNGFNAERNTFVQYYGGATVDAALLFIPLVGFLPPDDPRVLGTVTAIERDLLNNGLLRRYDTDDGFDGLDGDEGAFLACSFWLCDVYHLCGRDADALKLFKHLLGFANDLGLLSEEYDPCGVRQLGNFPQAFSHVALINTAYALSGKDNAAAQRATGERDAVRQV